MDMSASPLECPATGGNCTSAEACSVLRDLHTAGRPYAPGLDYNNPAQEAGGIEPDEIRTAEYSDRVEDVIGMADCITVVIRGLRAASQNDRFHPELQAMARLFADKMVKVQDQVYTPSV